MKKISVIEIKKDKYLDNLIHKQLHWPHFSIDLKKEDVLSLTDNFINNFCHV